MAASGPEQKWAESKSRDHDYRSSGTSSKLLVPVFSRIRCSADRIRCNGNGALEVNLDGPGTTVSGILGVCVHIKVELKSIG